MSQLITISRLVRLFILSVWVFTISACQFVPAKTTDSVEAKDPTQAQETEAAVSVNPYAQIKRRVSDDALARFSESIQLMTEQQWPEAEQQLLQLIEDYPSFSGPMVNLAIVYEAQNLDDQAESYYQRALTTNTLNVDAHNRYAVFLRERGRFAEAEQAYLQALGIWQDHPESHRNIAILYDLYMGRLDEALEHYRQYALLREDDGAQEDKQVKRWITDLERRLKKQAVVTAGGPS